MPSYAVNHPRNCYCRSLSRHTYDEILAREILPLVPRSEWNIFWDAEALPASVGSNHQIGAYSVLRHIFLFLPLDTETLLAVSSTCSSWRIISDRLPHWRILLPLKYELREIVSKMHWHLPAAWEIEKIPYEISESHLFRTNYHLSKGHASETDDSKFCHHFRLRGVKNLSDSLETRYKEEYDKVGWLEAQMMFQRKCKSADVEGNWACSCEDDGSLISCSCLMASACFCSQELGRRAYANDYASKRSDDVNLQEIERGRILQFLNHGNGSSNIHCDDNYHNFAEVAIGNNVVVVNDNSATEHMSAIDFVNDNENSSENNNNNNNSTTRNRRGVWDARRNNKSRNNNNKNSNHHRLLFSETNHREPFENEHVVPTFISDKNRIVRDIPPFPSSSISQKLAGVYHDSLSAYFEKKMKLRRQMQAATAIKATLDAGVPEELATLLSGENDDDDDDDENNNSANRNNISGIQNSKLTANEALKILAEAENEKQVMMSRNHVVPLHPRIFFQSISGAPSKSRDYMNHFYLEQPMTVYDAARPEDSVARNKGENLIKFLVERDEHRTDSRTYLQAIPMTLLENADYIMNCPEHRRRHCFLTFSSFAEETRVLMKEYEETVLNFVPELWKPCWAALRWFPEMTRELNQWVAICSLLIGICLTFALVIPSNLDSTHISQTDAAVGSVVGVPCLTFVFVYFLSMMKHLGDYNKYGLRSKVYGQGWMFLMCTSMLISLIVVPLALVNFRTTILDKLVNGGEISIEDFYNNSKSQQQQQQQSSSSSSILNRINPMSTQCKLPSEYLPTSLALKSSFVYFPPGTKILYHPPNVNRTVPFASIFDTNNNSCRIQNNSLVAFDDMGFNQAKNNLISRGSIGYYTVFLRESQSSSTPSIKNFTLLILGDFSSCPFWSANNSSSVSSQENIHPRFRSLLKSRPSSDAIGNASLISKQLEDSLMKLEFNSNPIQNKSNTTLICQNAANALVEVAGPASSGVDDKKLHLRVSSEFSAHFTSYFDPSATRPDGNGVGSWANSLEYQLNGIVALMADSSIFVAHENSAFPIVPRILDDDDRIFSSSFVSSNRIWSSATLTGLKNLQSDFHDASDRIITFMLVFYLGFCVFGIFCCAGGIRESVLQLISGFLVCFVLFVPIPALVVTSLCFQHGVENVKDELRQPIVCLAGSRADIVPSFTVSIMQISISTIGACCLGCLLLLMGCGYNDQEGDTG